MIGHTEAPKWKLKANWLLKELVRIWEGSAAPAPLFEGGNFVTIFKHLMAQYLQDCGFGAPQGMLDICITQRRITFSAIHGTAPTFASQTCEAEWIAEAVALHVKRLELMEDDTLKLIFRLAHAIEDILTTCGTLPCDYLQSADELLDRPASELSDLPTLPIVE